MEVRSTLETLIVFRNIRNKLSWEKQENLTIGNILLHNPNKILKRYKNAYSLSRISFEFTRISYNKHFTCSTISTNTEQNRGLMLAAHEYCIQFQITNVITMCIRIFVILLSY